MRDRGRKGREIKKDKERGTWLYFLQKLDLYLPVHSSPQFKKPQNWLKVNLDQNTLLIRASWRKDVPLEKMMLNPELQISQRSMESRYYPIIQLTYQRKERADMLFCSCALMRSVCFLFSPFFSTDDMGCHKWCNLDPLSTSSLT